MFPECFLLAFTQIAEWICHDSTCPRLTFLLTLDNVVIHAMQVPMHPDIRKWKQVIECIAKASGSRRKPVARVGTEQTGSKVRHRDRGSIEWHGKRITQPGLARKRHLADTLCQNRFALLERRVFAEVVIRGAVGLGSRLHL